MRFTSHRDFSRALERAVRRAEIPVAYSSGFTPHPRISYANASPTGVASEAEYMEIGLQEPMDPVKLAEQLNAALPEGLDIVEVVAARTPEFTERLEATEWEIELVDADEPTVAAAVAALLAAPEAIVERLTKQGMRSFDARGPILRLELASASQISSPRPGSVILKAVIRHVIPAVRPDDLLAALRVVAGLSTPLTVVTRLAQGPLDAERGVIGDPLAPDRG